MINLAICTNCHERPASYGDGLTWSRCSKCEREFRENENGGQIPEAKPAPLQNGDGVEHQLIEGLTSIILPVYITNSPLLHYTGNCIGSIREHTEKDITPVELIVVDNGSTNPPPSLNSYYADKVIQNTENLGVTKAWNQGIRASFGEYIVLLNNDTQVFFDWLPTMLTALDNGLDLVMATPMYSTTEPFARAAEAEREKMKYNGIDIKKTFSDNKDWSCVAFKKSLIAQVGQFDEQFFIFCQDSDFMKRMDQLGLKYGSCRAVPIHHIGDATGKNVEKIDQILTEDKARLEEKWKNPPAVPTEYAEADMLSVEEDIPESIKETPELEVEPVEPKKTAPLIRTVETGDAIYLFDKENKAHHVKNPETLKALGYGFGMETTIDKEEFSRFSPGEAIDMKNVEKYKSV